MTEFVERVRKASPDPTILIDEADHEYVTDASYRTAVPLGTAERGLSRAAGEVERRFASGLYLLNTSTWSRARDNASGHLETANGDSSRVNMADLEGEFGTSGYNQPLNNTSTIVWELPFGRGRRWGSNAGAVLDGLAGAWQLTAVKTLTSGVPVNLTYPRRPHSASAARSATVPTSLATCMRQTASAA